MHNFIERYGFVAFICLISIQVTGFAKDDIQLQYDPNTPQIAFAVDEIEAELIQAGYLVSPSGTFMISIEINSLLGFEVYEIRNIASGIQIKGGDAAGAMYGRLEVAEQIRLMQDVTLIPDADGQENSVINTIYFGTQ